MNRRAPTIVIAGGGVVGLALAALLGTGRAADRLQVHVLEARVLPRWQADEADLRVYALSRASQQLFEHVGAWSQVLAARASPYRRMQVFEGADPFAPGALAFDSADIGEPDLGHIVEDNLLRTALTDRLAVCANVELGIGVALEAIEVERSRATVQLANGGRVAATVLIGADGSDSVVRRLLELPVVAHSYAQTALVTHVTSTRPHRQTAWQRFLPGGPLALLPLCDGRSSVVWSLPTVEAERLKAVTDTDFLAELTIASAEVLGDFSALSRRAGFPLQALHALKYTMPRVALAGDAAHTVHPLAGQGMNLGLLDAAVLAEVIEDAVLAGEDPGDLKVLKRYERERKGDNLAMLTAFDALNRLYRLPSWMAPVRSLGTRALNSSSLAKGMLMRTALGISTSRRRRQRWSAAEPQA